MKLHLAKDFDIPIEAVTQTFAAIGRKGAGKTYLATMVAEQMLDAEAQVVVIDPVGNWWGLRVGADGKSKGKEIFVIGGEHGDVPLVPEAGARIARLLVEKRISAVLDVSTFRQGERKRFAADFAEEFFHLKKGRRDPVHIFVEEAQLFIPQRVGPDEARMVGAWESIIRLGRNYGIGATLVTQRPQSVNKEVLSQVECLCVLQVNGTHERKALEEWVQEAGADRELVGQLPGLERGVGYVWSPSWLRVFKKVHFAKKETFDASATPEVGKETKAASLSAVDVKTLLNDLTEVVKLAEQDDPKALKRKIRELEAQLGKPKELAVDLKSLKHAHAEGFQNAVHQFKPIIVEREKAVQMMKQKLKQIGELVTNGLPYLSHPVNLEMADNYPKLEAIPQIQRNWRPSTNGELKGGGMRRMLNVLARFPEGRTRKQIALQAGLSPNSGSFSTYLAKLRSAGFMDGSPERLSITQAGLSELGSVDPMPEGQELFDYWCKEVGGGMERMLRALRNGPLSRTALAEAAGMSAESGSFSTYLARLRTLELIQGRGEIELSEELVG